MGKADLLDRVAQGLILLAGGFSLAFGLFMLSDPFGWYELIDTVKFTGPPNQHFIRDIGLAYVIAGLMLAFAGRNPNVRWLAAFSGSLWLALHGALHIWEVVTGVCAPNVFWRDAPGVLGPPLLVWVALAILFARQRITPAGIPNVAFLGVVDRLTPGESAYIHEVAKAPGHALEKLKHFMPAAQHRHEAPAELFHMARIGATLVEDCGPCALTAARGALSDGVSREVVNAALAASPAEGDQALGFAFGQAIATQSADALTLGEQIEAKFGRTVRLELAMTTAMVRAYPAMKRGLGLTKACSTTRLKV
jgi:hypothetical protein